MPTEIPVSELKEVLQRAATSLLAPLDPDGLLARHLKKLLGLLKTAYEQQPTEQIAEARQRSKTWIAMKRAIQKEAPSQFFADTSYKGVHREITDRLERFFYDDYLGTDYYRFWFELESDGRNGARIRLRRKIISPGDISANAASLPSPLPDFYGREAELAEIEGSFCDKRYFGVSLFGLRTGGKTELAVVAAHRLSTHLGGRVRFVTAKDAMNGDDVLRRLMSVDEDGGKSRNDFPIDRFRGAANTLFIVDDVSPELDASLLRPANGSFVILTSVHPIVTSWLLEIRVEDFTPEESRGYLLKSVPRLSDCGYYDKESALPVDDVHRITHTENRDIDCADHISILLGHLPLALALATRTLTQMERLEPSEYIKQLATGDRIRELDTPSPAHVLDKALQACYDTLPESTQAAFRALALFAGTFNMAAAEALVGPDALADLDLLAFRRLLRWDAVTRRYRMLELVRAYASHRTPATERDAIRTALTTYFVDRSYALFVTGTGLNQESYADFERDKETLLDLLRWLEPRWNNVPDTTYVSLVLACAYIHEQLEIFSVRLFADRRQLPTLLDRAVTITATTTDRALRESVLSKAARVLRDSGRQEDAGRCMLELIGLARDGDAKRLQSTLWMATEQNLLPNSLRVRLSVLLELLAGAGEWQLRTAWLGRIGVTQAYLGDHAAAFECVAKAESLLDSVDAESLPFRYSETVDARLSLLICKIRIQMLSGDAGAAATALDAARLLAESRRKTDDDSWAIVAEATALFGNEAFARSACARAYWSLRTARSRKYEGYLAIGRTLVALRRYRTSVLFLNVAVQAGSDRSSALVYVRSPLLVEAEANLFRAYVLNALGLPGEAWSYAQEARDAFLLLESDLAKDADVIVRAYEH